MFHIRALFGSLILTLFLPLSGSQSLTVNNPTTSSWTAETTATTDPGDICPIVLANNQSITAANAAFKGVSGSSRRAVYINLKVLDSSGKNRSFEIGGNDTFAPEQWVWATPKGKNLLRMPLDYIILSLGILSMGTTNLEIVLDESTENCLRENAVPYDITVHLITKFLALNVTANGTNVDKDFDGPVICRSAYAFSHRIFVDKGIGYKCCSSPSKDGELYVCETPYTISWEMVWYGPVALLCWIYAIFLLHFYKLYRHSFNLKKIRELSGLKQTLKDIKADMTNRIVRMSEDLARIKTQDELIAMREHPGFLDILGVDKAKQSTVTSVARVVFTLTLISLYYIAVGLFLYEYRIQLESTFHRLKDSGAIYLNILGHLGWVFCDMSIGITQYAVFELIYTLFMPIFAFMVYLSITFRQDAVDFAESKKEAQKSIRRSRDIIQLGKMFMPAVTGIKRLFLRFVISKCGKTFQGICFILFFLYIIFIAGIFITYLVYFVGLGVFANIDVISPYIIPIFVCCVFFANSFNPAYGQYAAVKDMIFTICLENESHLIIKKHKEIFLKRELVDNFYVPNSRSTIYNCILRILIVIAIMLLFILVILTIQYPYYFQMDSIVSFLGVQVVFFLPLLSGFMGNNNQLSALEETILKRDLKAYIDQYEREHPESTAAIATDSNGPSEDSALDNDDDAPFELGEIAYGNPVTDPIMSSSSDEAIHSNSKK